MKGRILVGTSLLLLAIGIFCLSREGRGGCQYDEPLKHWESRLNQHLEEKGFPPCQLGSRSQGGRYYVELSFAPLECALDPDDAQSFMCRLEEEMLRLGNAILAVRELCGGEVEPRHCTLWATARPQSVGISEREGMCAQLSGKSFFFEGWTRQQSGDSSYTYYEEHAAGQSVPATEARWERVLVRSIEQSLS
jgi:hypothetical protein